ncbi:hypothetical protein EDC96DRAFT_576003 [Choanephora cucurbitarum]|nr:hypothetical protein EDC96DRAFT_576003 [Choanephora cucurbitarum]
MSYKLLSGFESLDLVEKSCLKLSISGIIGINSDVYKKQYKAYLPLQLYQQVSNIEPQRMMTGLKVAEFNKVYDECKKASTYLKQSMNQLTEQCTDRV